MLKMTARRGARRAQARSAFNAILLGATALCALPGGAQAVDPGTLPSGGQVTAGQSTIARSGNQMTITQTSQRAAIAWQGYSIGSAAGITYVQPNAQAISLNRVTGNDPSLIYGRLSANGQVWLVNPNGILFGRSARVDAAGLVASTANLGMSDQEFVTSLDTRFAFNRPGRADAAVVNHGEISVREAGLAALVAPGVVNAGTINARLGRVALGSGTSFVLDLYGDRLINLSLGEAVVMNARDGEGSPVRAGVENTGEIMTDGGRIELRANVARGVVDSVVRSSGDLVARSASVAENGDIILDGGERGVVEVAGKIDASGAVAGEAGGRVRVLGENIRIASTARLDASGDRGGGTILVGGNVRGQGPERNAAAVRIERGARLRADGRSAGRGGTVVVWSESWTLFNGAISARGGAAGGDGGFVETSSRGVLTVGAGAVDAAAPIGAAGTWLLDPRNVTIVAGANANGAFDGGSPNTFTPSGDDALVNRDIIQASLDAGTSVTIRTSGGGSQAGNITVDATITKSAGGDATLSLLADGSIIVNQAIAVGGGPGALDVFMGSANTVTLNAVIGSLNGGTLSGTATVANVNGGGLIQNGVDVLAAGGVANVAGSHVENVTLTRAVTLNGAAGAVVTAAGGAVITIQASGVTVRGLEITGAGGAVDGIVVDNSAVRSSVTIRDNDIHDFANDGVRIGSGGGAAVIATLVAFNTIDVGRWAVNVDVPQGGLGSQAISIVLNESLTGGVGGARIAGLGSGTVNVLDNGTILGSGTAVLVASMTGGFVNIGANDLINGSITGVELDGVAGSVVHIFSNTAVSGGVTAIAADGISNSFVTININGTITGGTNGIVLSGIGGTRFIIYDNGPIVGTLSDGIAIDGITGSQVVVGATDAIRGGVDGVRVAGAGTSAIHFLANGTITGGTAGARIDGTAASLVSVNGNGPISGGLDGIAIANVQGSTIVAEGNESITGLAGAGVNVTGASASLVSIDLNDAIGGATGGVAATGMANSTLSINENGTITGALSGVELQGTTRSQVTVDGNESVTGASYGVHAIGSLDAGIDVSGNGLVSGALAGVAFEGAMTSFLTVTGNQAIQSATTAVDFAGLIETHAVVSGNAITGGTGIAFVGTVGGIVDVLANSVTALADALVLDGRGAGPGVTAVTIAGNALAFAQGGAGGGGIAVLTDSPGAPRGVPDSTLAAFFNVAFGAGNSITGTGAPVDSPFLTPADPGFEVALRFDGANSAIIGDTLGDMSFAAIAGNYVTFANHALYNPGAPTLIDATAVSFDGFTVGDTPPGAFRDSLIAAIESRINDFDDRAGADPLSNPSFVGQIFFVAPPGGAPPVPPAVAADLGIDRVPVDGPFSFVADPFAINQPIGVPGAQGTAMLTGIAPAAGPGASAGDAAACATAPPDDVANDLLGNFTLGDVGAFATQTQECASRVEQR